MYDIRMEADRRLVGTRLSGFLSVAEVDAFVGALRQRFLAAPMREGYLLMVDMSEAVLQSQEVIAAFRRHIGFFPKAERIAIVSASTIARMQIRRVMTQPYARLVATVAEAEAWLFDAVEPHGEPSAA